MVDSQIWLTKKWGAIDQKGLSKLFNSIFAFATCCFHDPQTINSSLLKIIKVVSLHCPENASVSPEMTFFLSLGEQIPQGLLSGAHP